MYTRNQMESMSNEELNVIAQQKNEKRTATKEALQAQKIIWSRRFYVAPRQTLFSELDDMQRNFMSYWID